MNVGLLSVVVVILASFIHWVSLRWREELPVIMAVVTYVISFGFFMYVVGFRELNAGNDTINYVITFIALDGVLTAREIGESIFGNGEPLFWVLVAVLKLFTSNPKMFVILTSCLSYLLSSYAIYLVVKRTLTGVTAVYMTVFSLAVLFAIYEIVYFGNHIRASIAIPLAIISVCYYEQREKKSLVFFTLALSIHYSSIILILYPILDRVLDRKLGVKYVLIASAFVYLASHLFIDLVLLVDEDYLRQKSNLYLDGNVEAAITSIFSMSSTWVIFFIALASLINTGVFKGKPVFFFLIIILVFSSFPLISIRFYPFLLMLSVPGFIDLLINRLGISVGIFVTALSIILVTYIMFGSQSVIHTLGLALT